MTAMPDGMRYVDLHFQAVPAVIATAVLDGRDGVTLVDPGPGSCLERLHAELAALGMNANDVSTILLTHIHLDHAGASGSLVAENPRIRVFVHERGARHMIDPAKLLDSARRLYGEAMDRLWGEFLPVPDGNVQVLTGGERIEVAGRRLEVAYTPGHASHHVAYFDDDSGLAFVGDTAGVRIGASTFIMAPTPPPDIDLEAWASSVERILAWKPETLFLTHFGPSPSPGTHLQELLERLRTNAAIARRALQGGGTDAEQATRFQLEMREELRQHMTEDEAVSYELAVPLDHCYLGLARYWRKAGA
jgi:glyoxylase-like metal-dependent hydrolase (beta-lactamase superfamily II)